MTATTRDSVLRNARTWRIILAAAVGLAGLSLIGANHVLGSSNLVTLTTAPSDVLASEGINLEAPTSAALISRSQAETAAQLAFPQAGGVREAILVHLNSPSRPLADGRLYWVVSLDLKGMPFPGQGPLGSPQLQAKPSFLLVFIDAATGKFVFANMH